MKTVTYSGPAVSLGRFGSIEDGATLQLTEAEFASVKDDTRFTLLSRRRPAKDVKPLGSPSFDLRTIKWNHPKMETVLARKGRTGLLLIAKAMNEVGAEVIVSVHDGSAIIIDSIATEARACGWDKIPDEERETLPVIAQPVKAAAADGEEDEDDGEAERARDEDGKFVGDDPSTPDVNEAYDPPKPAAKKTARKRND